MKITKNFLHRTEQEKEEFILSLRRERDELLKKAQVEKIPKRRRARIQKIKFDSPELERLFYSLPKDCQDVVLGK